MLFSLFCCIDNDRLVDKFAYFSTFIDPFFNLPTNLIRALSIIIICYYIENIAFLVIIDGIMVCKESRFIQIAISIFGKGHSFSVNVYLNTSIFCSWHFAISTIEKRIIYHFYSSGRILEIFE